MISFGCHSGCDLERETQCLAGRVSIKKQLENLNLRHSLKYTGLTACGRSGGLTKIMRSSSLPVSALIFKLHGIFLLR